MHPLVEAIARLPRKAQERCEAALGGEPQLTPRQERDVFGKNLNGMRPRKFTSVVSLILEKRMRDAEFASKLTPEYVREYLLGVLEFCPTDYFTPAEDGGWLCDPDTFSRLPHEVRRFVDHVEYRRVRGNQFLAVTFVSKTSALTIAAKYVLTQKIAVAAAVVPWDQLAAEAPALDDDVERRLDAAAERPVRSEEAPLA